MEMIRREVELRKAPETLAAMECAEDSVQSEWMDVVEGVQHQVVTEFHESSHRFSAEATDITLQDLTDITVQDLRAAALRHPEVAFWVKHNRARRGTLEVGDAAPNVIVRRAVDEELSMLLKDTSMSGSENAERTVLVAGSLS